LPLKKKSGMAGEKNSRETQKFWTGPRGQDSRGFSGGGVRVPGAFSFHGGRRVV
jgi:hypothetical protein